MPRSAEIWSKFKNGYSIRLLTPQMYHDGVWKLLSALEHEFQCRVSAEAVLAPLNASAGKSAAAAKAAAANKDATVGAVSYDNTNSLVLQLEGHSRWRIAANPHADLQMPLQAGCVSLKDIDFWSKPEVDVTLSPGDTLYIPKGWVYQQDNNGSPVGGAVAAAGGDQHSLHLKVCANHGTTSTVADLLEIVMPQALAEAVQSRAELRRGLPRSYHQHLGIAHSETEGDAQRAQLRQKIAALMEIVTSKAVDILDPAADQVRMSTPTMRFPLQYQCYAKVF
jgi:lysine-specific demethylase/histidyl-hydroxylase NO66